MKKKVRSKWIFKIFKMNLNGIPACNASQREAEAAAEEAEVRIL